MLEALRRGVKGIFMQALLGLLVIAFAIWGIADVFQGRAQTSLAQVGKTEISQDQFQQALQLEISALSRQFGRRLTVEQARQFGIDQRVLSSLIGKAALDAHAHELGLHLSDAAIAEAIRNDPTFQGPSGTFDRNFFTELLRQNGLSEQHYFAERRGDEVREQLTDTLAGGNVPPDYLIQVLHRYQGETRTIAHMTLDPAASAKVEAPDEAKLKAYYEQHKSRFVAPEFRKVPLILLTTAAVQQRVAVSEDEMKDLYDREKATFATPERRHIQQLSFPDRAAAEKALATLKAAPNFEEGLKGLGLKEADIDLGTLAKSDMIDKVIADAAFKLEKGQLSDPVAGTFSTVLLRVTDITPGKQSTFDEVKGQLRDRIASERVNREMQDLHDRIDDARAGGSSLKEVAEKLNLPFVEIAATDKQGMTPEGKPALDNPDAARVIASAFEGGSGMDRLAVELTDGGYAWVDVAGVTPERQKPFEEVQEAVKTAWIEAEQRTALNAAGQKIVERIDKGEALEAIAKELGLEVKLAQPVTRTQQAEGLTRAAVQRAFALPRGKAAAVESADGKSRTIIVVRAIVDPPQPTPEQMTKLRQELSRQLQGDAISAYVSALQSRLGFSVNQTVYRRAMGIETQQP
ncbi:MAG TPA: SurA N-terminal domain-containing protein [Hyphomicrobiaceae bacterium]|nr:SurA N-terminal domain-containing protein [Hyphomicrobiaceae bacterium]